MTPAETAEALTVAAAFDRRTIGEADVLAWHAALGDLDLDDVKDAIVGHYRDSRDWLMPADIRTRVKAVARVRADQHAALIPDADPDNPVAYIEAMRAKRFKPAQIDAHPRPAELLIDQVAQSAVIP
jgi:hypothetical protein